MTYFSTALANSHSTLRHVGGWASASCPHMVVYCIKFVLRGESPRDYVDMLRSLKYPPSISISDIPQRLAAHANSTISRFFRPNEGRLFPPTEDNIASAKEGSLICHLPWVQGAIIPRAFRFGSQEFEEELHPVTGVSERYSLFDRFHERNSTSPSHLLRRVPELNVVVNTEVEEQLHNSINRSNYSFNMMLPGNHLFMMRLKLHSSNTKINQVYRKKLETVFRAHLGPHTSLLSDERGILILQRTLFERERHSRDSVMAATHTSSTTSTSNENSFAQQSSAADGVMHTTDGHPNVTLPPKSNNLQQVNLVI